MNLLGLDVLVGTSAKLTAAYTPELRNIQYHTESVIHQHLFTCEQFQHFKALLELYPGFPMMTQSLIKIKLV